MHEYFILCLNLLSLVIRRLEVKWSVVMMLKASESPGKQVVLAGDDSLACLKLPHLCGKLIMMHGW